MSTASPVNNLGRAASAVNRGLICTESKGQCHRLLCGTDARAAKSLERSRETVYKGTVYEWQATASEKSGQQQSTVSCSPPGCELALTQCCDRKDGGMAVASADACL